MPLLLLPLLGGVAIGGGSVWYLTKSRWPIYLAIAVLIAFFFMRKSSK